MSYDDLKARLPVLQKHVESVAINHGSYEELNKAVGQTQGPANQGAANLRQACLLFNLIATATAFAKAKRADDISFRIYQDPLKDRAFLAECCKRAGLNPSALARPAAAFIALLDQSLPVYSLIKPMRDKALAHLSMQAFTTPVIENVTVLSRNSVVITEQLFHIFEGAPLRMSTLAIGAKSQVRALMRSDRPARC